MCWGTGLIPLSCGEFPPIPVLPALQHIDCGLSPLGNSWDRGRAKGAALGIRAVWD